MGKPSFADTEEHRKRNQLRSDVRDQSKAIGQDDVLTSCQSCFMKDNMCVLEHHISRLNHPNISDDSRTLVNHLKGLRAVLQMLLSTIPTKTNKTQRDIQLSYMEFEDALGLYLAYNSDTTPFHIKLKTERKRFKEMLCHPKYGLCVYILMDKYVVLKADDTDMELFFGDLIQFLKHKDPIQRLDINNKFVEEMMETVDTEWDRKLLYALLGASRSRKELDDLGIDSDNICKLTNSVVSIIQERINAKLAAEDMVSLRLKKQLAKLHEEIDSKEKQYILKQSRWSEVQLDELHESIDDLKARIESLKSLMRNETKIDKKKLNQMVRRTQGKLIQENRLGLRKASTGRPLSLDDEDEQFILSCIESKSTAHGRRHDSVMYLHHRVKKSDFLKLANYNRISRGLKPIKSATTVYNRGRPKNQRSTQAKHHLGLGLLCMKKPPKAEGNDNELTHHQRAHKKNILTYLCGPETKTGDGHGFNFIISQDEKAYICPGTSTGMRGARNEKIVQPTDLSKSRKLPKYDFPLSMINVTPAGHRVMTKVVEEVEGQEEIKSIDDETIVFTRPKYFVGGSATVWASEFMWLHSEDFDLFEVKKLALKSPSTLKR